MLAPLDAVASSKNIPATERGSAQSICALEEDATSATSLSNQANNCHQSPTIEDFWGGEDLSEAAETPLAPAPSGQAHSRELPLRDFLLDELADELAHFHGLETLKAIFWELLAFERVDLPLSTETVAPPGVDLASVTLFARHDGVHVLAVQCQAGSYTRRILETVVERATRQFPAAAVLFGDFAWLRVMLGFVEPGDEDARPGFLRLCPATNCARLAQRLGRLRTYGKDDSPRSGSVLLASFRSLLLVPRDHVEDHTDIFAEPCLDAVQLHLRDLNRYSTMSREETLACLAAIEKMGPLTRVGRRRVRDIPEHRMAEYRRIRDRLITGHHRLCHNVIKRFGMRRWSHSMSWTDLMQEGIFGLLRAIDLFESRRGYEFSTYACHWIRQAVVRAIHNKDLLIRLPSHCWQGETRLPLPERRRFRWMLSLSANEYGITCELADASRSDPADEWAARERQEYLRAMLANSLQTITNRERHVLSCRFGLGGRPSYTLNELGRMYGLTRERIRQIEAKALEKLARRTDRVILAETLT
jgi:RNA polymerase sigma factor (sigma-70 family)